MTNRATSVGDNGDIYKTKRRRTTIMGICFMLPITLYLLIFLIFPILRSAFLSMQDWDIMSFVSNKADFVGLKNYQTILSDPDFPHIALNSVLFTVVSLIFQFIFGLALAVFFTKRFPLSATLRSLILLPWLLPVISSATVWRWMFNQDSGIINFLLGGQHIG
ncbi:carbohydrate ABC transporter permease, partial [Bifidobacterium pullorum]|uniref:carbohydrate ABC transporter permease n=3 Tax=Bifidobacterium TaxID=1678 RepID=UPI003AF08B59